MGTNGSNNLQPSHLVTRWRLQDLATRRIAPISLRSSKEGELGLLSHNNQSYYSKYLNRWNCHTLCVESAALQRLLRSYTSLLVIPGCCGRTYANQLFLIKHKI